MDNRLVNIQRASAKLASLSKALSILFIAFFVLYSISIAAILLYMLLLPQGFSYIEPSSPLALVPLMLDSLAKDFVLLLLGLIFRDIGKGSSPFSARRIKQIQILGALFLVIALSNSLAIPGVEIGAANGDAHMSFYDNRPSDSSIYIDFSGLLTAATCFALSLVFKYGSILQQETSDLI